MKTNKLLMIGVGMVVLYVLYKKFYTKESEETAGAYGRKPMTTSKSWGQQCVCQGEYMGSCINPFGIGDCCLRKCRKEIFSKL
jgi:hypothetical protein